MAREHAGSETLDYTQVHSVLEALKEMTGGRGPDACIDAVGMEAHGTGSQYAYDRVKQALRLETDRGQALREAIMACRKGGTLSVLGVYGMIDKFPMGVIMNKGMTVRTAQQHGQAYMDRCSRMPRRANSTRPTLPRTASASRTGRAATTCSSTRRTAACVRCSPRKRRFPRDGGCIPAFARAVIRPASGARGASRR